MREEAKRVWIKRLLKERCSFGEILEASKRSGLHLTLEELEEAAIELQRTGVSIETLSPYLTRDDTVSAIKKKAHTMSLTPYLEKTSLPFKDTPPGIIRASTLIEACPLFTLNTDERKARTVHFDVRTPEGQVVRCSVLIGKWSHSGEELGILKEKHAHAFYTLLEIWKEKGFPISSTPQEGHVEGYISISAYELTKRIVGSTGEKDYQYTKNVIGELQSLPISINFPQRGELVFTLLGGFTWKLKKDFYDKPTRDPNLNVYIKFNHILTQSYILKDIRFLSLKTYRSLRHELGRLLFRYLDPKLLSLPPRTAFSRTLKGLIEDLQLPQRKWHKHSSYRKQLFEKAVKELNRCVLSDNKSILHCKISQAKTSEDFLLSASRTPTPSPEHEEAE